MARRKAWGEANKERLKAYTAATKERRKEWTQANKERVKAKAKARVDARRKANPEIFKAKGKRRIARAPDSYIRKLYKSEAMTPELLEAARMRLFIKRKLSEFRNETHK